MVVVITGSVATGKTTLAHTLSLALGYEYVDVNLLLRENHLGDYDVRLDSLEVEEDTVVQFLKSLVHDHSRLVFDSHLSHLLDSSFVELCVVCTCSLPVLKKRLEERDYSPMKVRENLDAEVFEVCLREAEEKRHKILIIDTSISSVDDCVEKILDSLSSQ